jgi:hypothetical protein
LTNAIGTIGTIYEGSQLMGIRFTGVLPSPYHAIDKNILSKKKSDRKNPLNSILTVKIAIDTTITINPSEERKL